METRQIRRTDRNEKAQTRRSDSDSEDAADQSEQHAFEEQFARDAAASGAQCRANGEFELASFGANQQQIGNVDAGDQQHQSNRAHDHPKNTAHVANDFLLQGMKVGCDPPCDEVVRVASRPVRE